MKHHAYNPNFNFVVPPQEFNRHTERDFLQYCLGATLYMPGTKEIAKKIIEKDLGGLTSMVMCFEDSIDVKDLSKAENNVCSTLQLLETAIRNGKISSDDIPLIMIRVRNLEQFIDFTKRLPKKHLRLITGFVFPKLTTKNGYKYLGHLTDINIFDDCQIYGLPILESKEIAMIETRTYELTGIKSMLKPYKDDILNIRVGATDFSSNFGVRRGIDYTIYDILMVRDCLSDILNLLLRTEDDYVISAPVWEYFLTDDKDVVKPMVEEDIHSSLLKRNRIVNPAIDGLLREVILDKANGFVGKTIIHPSHLKYVNAMQAVTKEEYGDALQILETEGGVVKSEKRNKMNEINPHRSWAIKTVNKAKAFGVIENEAAYKELFSIDSDRI